MTTHPMSRCQVSIIAYDAHNDPSLAHIKRAISALTRTCKVTITLRTYRPRSKGRDMPLLDVIHANRERQHTAVPSGIILYHGRPDLQSILRVWHSVDDIWTPGMTYHDVIERLCAVMVRIRNRRTALHAIETLTCASESFLSLEGIVAAPSSIRQSVASDIVIGFPQPYIYFRGCPSPALTTKEMIVARMLIDTLHGDYAHIDDLERALFGDSSSSAASRRSTIRRYVSRTWGKLGAILAPHMHLICRRGVGYKLMETADSLRKGVVRRKSSLLHGEESKPF